MGKENIKRNAAIRFTIECGMELKKNLEISNAFRSGLSLEQIAVKYNVNKIFKLNKGQNYAKNIVRFALRGNKDEILGPVYQGLMKKEEFEKYAEEHMKKRWQNAGRETYKNNTGIHGRDLNQRIKDSLKGVRSKNQVPWEDEEMIIATILSNREEYQVRGKKSNKRIALGLNKIYHSKDEIRTSEAVSYIFRQRKDYLEGLIQDKDLVEKVIITYLLSDS